MGAYQFYTEGKGATMKEAFDAARDQAAYEHGHGGYTGTIAEKTSAVLITMPEDRDARSYAADLMESGDPRIDDKWGPAGAIKIAADEWLFFGWASS